MTVAPPTGGLSMKSAPPPTGGDGSPRGFNAAIIHLLRKMMQNARDASTSIEVLKRAVEQNAADRKTVVGREFTQYEANARQLDEQISEAARMADEDPAFDVGDQVTLIEDAWNRAKGVMPAGETFEKDPIAAHVVKDLDAAQSQIRNVHFYCARLTAPSQVRQYVEELRPGNTVSIHDILKEDIPDKTQRDELILYLKTARISIPGIIDVATGVITRYESDKRALTNSLILVIAAAVLPPALALLASLFWPSLPQLHGVATSDQVATFFPIFGGVWAGAGLHVIIDIVKARKGSNPDALASVEDFKLYVNSNQGSIIVGLIVLIVVAVGTAYLGPTLGFGGSVFVGYSADSIADVILERFEKVVDTQTGSVKTVLGGG